MNRFFSVLIFLVCAFISKVNAQTFYSTSSIQKIELQFSQSNWDYILDTVALGSGNYSLAQSVKINGVLLDSVAVKYKGNSSYDSTYAKNPIHIKLDSYKAHSYQGYKDVKLSNCYADPSMIREVLAYDILKNYADCPVANFAQVYINGKYIGVYSNDEAINKKFLSDHFSASSDIFIKCNPIVLPTTNTKSNLRYIPLADSSAYYNYYELKSNYGWNQLKDLCDSVTNNANSIPNVMDLDRSLWMLSFNNVLINLDSYSGAFCQNYYLYKDLTGRFSPIIWDLNMSFAGFPHLGTSNSSMASLTIPQLQQLPSAIHTTDQYWPLIKNVMSNNMYKRMYIAHMKTMLNEMFVSNYYGTRATQLQGVIDTAVLSDVNKFYSYSQFQNGMTANVSVGSYSVPGISTLMAGRISYLQSTADFTYTAPSISSATAANTPSLNSAVTITANVINTNSNGVYLGYRFSSTSKFIRVLMYDDGLHNDGAASDNKFGITFTMTGSSAQYYIYAENNNAGMFAPERAEHEFYTLTAVQPAGVGQVKINEFLADNVNDAKNENLMNEDWIELYNTTALPLELGGLYLTDTYLSPAKFVFPSNTVIPPYGYVIVWADENPSTASYVHCNFKLLSTGEQLMLSNSGGAVLDSITFGPQVTDKSIIRCPDGTGSFTVAAATTFKTSNCTIGINELGKEIPGFKIYPNPANEYSIVRNDLEKNESLEVFNLLGESIYKTTFSGSVIINTKTWEAGIYFVRSNGVSKKLIIAK